MEGLDSYINIMIFVIAIVFSFIMFFATFILAVIFTINAIEKDLPALGLGIYWILFIPSILIILEYDFVTATFFYFFYSLIPIGILIYYKIKGDQLAR